MHRGLAALPLRSGKFVCPLGGASVKESFRQNSSLATTRENNAQFSGIYTMLEKYKDTPVYRGSSLKAAVNVAVSHPWTLIGRELA